MVITNRQLPITLSRILWALVLVTLPVTSFKYMPFVGSGTYVRPLALYPLALLMPVLLYRLYRREIRNPWPGSFTVILAFVLAAAAATALGATFAPIELRGVDYWDRAIRAWVTLVIGLMFFVAAAWMNQDEADLKFSVKWLLVGLLGHLVWGAIQYYGLNHGWRSYLKEIQEIFSVRGLVKNKRVSGFAFEPSWLAAQLVLLYLPWLVGMSLTGNYFVLSTFDRKWKVQSGKWAVWALLLASLSMLLVTYSRSGLVVAVLAAGVTVLVAGRGLLANAWGWVRAGFNSQPESGWLAQAKRTGQRVLLFILLISILSAVGVFLADKGYIARLWTSDMSDFWAYVSDASLGPRVAYASAAMTAFDQNPLTGVGLGASGFHIYGNIPDGVLMGVPEIAEALSPDSKLYPNPKNLYVRLLAETGLAGFALFIAFWLGLLADALTALRKNAPWLKMLGTASIFTLAALALMAFTQDSFAMPELWVNLGILAGIFGAMGRGDPPRA
jgi:O-antigen ligase